MPRIHHMSMVGPDFVETAPVTNTLRQLIPAPAGVVFRCLEDGAAWSEWLGIDVTWTSSPPFGVGTTRTVTTRGATIEEVFTAWEDGRRMAFYFARSSLPVAAFAEDYLLEPRGDRACELTWSYGYEWGGPLKPVLSPLFAMGFAANCRRSLDKLTKLLDESGERWAA